MRARLSTQEIKEYNTLRFMAEKFNLKPHELEKYDPDWIDRMIAVANGESIGLSNRTSDKPGLSTKPGTIVNKITTTYGGDKKKK